MRSPYQVVQSLYLTEKAVAISSLHENTRLAAKQRSKAPKAVFLVATDANKVEIAQAVELIYADRKLKVTAVNTICAKPKVRRVRGRKGMKSGFKKAIVTFRAGDVLDDLSNA
ncbi:MAG: uL23 family ribosomal protein [Chlamydiia bacterium]